MRTARSELLKIITILLCALATWAGASAQEIPLGTWRFHLSYNRIEFIETTETRIYAASRSGLLVYHTIDQSLTTLNKLSGLNGTHITSLDAGPMGEPLVIGYADGSIDVLSENTISPFMRLRDSDVTTSKKINHISVRGSLAYLSTAYGVAVFDLEAFEIKETWRDLGAVGETLEVYGTAFHEDSVFLATRHGVLAGNLEDNLLDFNNWKRFTVASPDAPVPHVVVFNKSVHAAQGNSVFRLTGGEWLQLHEAQDEVTSLEASADGLLFIAGKRVFSLTAEGELSEIIDPLLTEPAKAKRGPEGKLWIGDRRAGLLSDAAGTFASYLPNGPTTNEVVKMVYHQDKLFTTAGGYSPEGKPLQRGGELNIFENGMWRVTVLSATDLTDVVFFGGSTWVSSFGSGVVAIDASGNTTQMDETNSPLVSNEGEAQVTAMATSAHGLWVATFNADQSLHLFKSDGSWESFSFNSPNSSRPVLLSVDGTGTVWMALDPGTGGGLLSYDKDNDRVTYHATSLGGGALPHQDVYSLAPDRHGYMWIGTGAGVAYFYSAAQDAVAPIFENRFLLRDEKVTALAIDAGNRKWIGTEHGAWLFNETGEELIHHFTTENSPLLSNTVLDIEINARTGEVFFATDLGVVSYRNDAAELQPGSGIVIFPNPVSPGFSGTVGISGLPQDAEVRITSPSGRLVWRTQANGGMASWNVRDLNGRRPPTGVYLVFARSEDGAETVVGKIAVIE